MCKVGEKLTTEKCFTNLKHKKSIKSSVIKDNLQMGERHYAQRKATLTEFKEPNHNLNVMYLMYKRRKNR